MTFSAVAFFVKHAGCSYDPLTETPEDGRVRCARELAKAETLARELGYSFRWDVDPDVTSADWIGARSDGGKYRDPWNTWVCDIIGPDGEFVDSLGGIDFGRDGEPWGEAYRRVIEAQLALENVEV